METQYTSSTTNQPNIFKEYKCWKGLGVALLAFVLGASIMSVPYTIETYERITSGDYNDVLSRIAGYTVSNNPINTFIAYFFTINAALMMLLPLNFCSPVTYKVAVRALNLGMVFGIGWLLLESQSVLHYFATLACVVTFFHWSEFIFICFVRYSQDLNLDAYELNSSLEYQIILVGGLIELYVEWVKWPDKFNVNLGSLPLGLVVLGEILRKLAILNLWECFSHDLSPVRGARLVTYGLYTVIRHPYYLGWMFWLVGLQLLLCNPITTCLAIVVFWNYFDERVNEEEFQLSVIYRQDFSLYQQKVPLTGLPLIRGFKVEFDR